MTASRIMRFWRSSRRHVAWVGSLMIVIIFTTFPVAAVSKVPIVFSHNWAGYAVDVQDVTLVHAAWTVPAVKRTSGNTYSSSWIGIGGTKSETLIQAGTAQEFENGQAVYYAWVEVLPQAAEQIASADLRVRPGDKVGVTIRNMSGDRWEIKIENASSGQSVVRSLTYASCKCSAEWIEEQPTIISPSGETLATLANFGTVTFSDAYAKVGGTTVSLAKLNVVAVNLMSEAKAVISTPGDLSESGNHFKITYGG